MNIGIYIVCISVLSHYPSEMNLLGGDSCIADCTLRHLGVKRPLSSL